MNEVRAYAKNVKGSPRKARIVADVVRGKNAVYAIDALKYMQKGFALKIKKVVESAVANAVNNFNMDAETLVITKIMIDSGPTLKRMHPQSRGRGRTILKRSSNITVFVGKPGDKTVAAKGNKPAAAKAEVKEVESKTKTPKTKSTKAKVKEVGQEDNVKVAKSAKTRPVKPANLQSRADNK